MTTLAPILDETWWSALERAAQRHGDRVAFHFEGPAWRASLTFRRWRELAGLAAAALARLGVAHGDRVALLAPGSPAWPVLQAAASALGAIVVPVNTRYRADELEHVLRLSRPRVVVTVDRYHRTDYRRLVADARGGLDCVVVTLPGPDVPLEVPAGGSTAPAAEHDWTSFLALGASSPPPTARVRPEDPVLLQFTSGTSAFPKGALLSSRATLGATWYLAERMRITDQDVYFSTQPMYHVGGSVATTLLPLGAGPTMVVPERYQVEEVFRLIRAHRCTARTGQAAMYAMELAHPDFDPADFATVTKGWSGGTPELKRIIRDRMGIPVVTTIYGLTETAGTTTITDADDPESSWIETCGRPIPGVELGIATREGIVRTPGIVGEICVRGWSVMLGYYEDDAATAAAIDADGWFHTGDLGRLDERGDLHFVDRLKDMIKPGGENVSAAEVERVISELPGVAQVAVVGRPDDRLGQVPVAFVELVGTDALDETAIIAHCTARMASFKVPRAVHLVDDWPMTESGKILKRELRRRLEESAGPRFVGQGG